MAIISKFYDQNAIIPSFKNLKYSLIVRILSPGANKLCSGDNFLQNQPQSPRQFLCSRVFARE